MIGFLLRYLVVDYLGLIHVLSNLDLKLLRGVTRARWSDVEVKGTKKIVKGSALKFT